MRLVRSEDAWCFLFPSGDERICLRGLALRCGYRICELCLALDCSQRYLHEVFSRDIGVGPKEWMRLERMVMARRRLTEGESPKEVAAVLGFTSPYNFRREFLAFNQVAPGEFRLKLMEEAEKREVLKGM